MSCDRAKLSKIVESSLANKRAAKDLMGIIAIKGGFVMDVNGVVSSVTGEGFTVKTGNAVAPGSFYIYFNSGKTPIEILDAQITCFVPKGALADETDYSADFAYFDLNATNPVAVGRGFPYSTGVVANPATYAIFGFQISGLYSTVGIYE